MRDDRIEAAARIQSSIAAPVMMRNTLPPLASNDLFGVVILRKAPNGQDAERLSNAATRQHDPARRGCRRFMV